MEFEVWRFGFVFLSLYGTCVFSVKVSGGFDCGVGLVVMSNLFVWWNVSGGCFFLGA